MGEKKEVIFIRCTPKVKKEFKKVAADFRNFEETIKFFINYYGEMESISERRGGPFEEAERIE